MPYTVHFEWPLDVPVGEAASFDLNAGTLELAKMQAAMLYATEEFEQGPPSGYRIIKDGATEVYRYPEPTVH